MKILANITKQLNNRLAGVFVRINVYNINIK